MLARKLLLFSVNMEIGQNVSLMTASFSLTRQGIAGLFSIGMGQVRTNPYTSNDECLP